jgi:aspartyl-tRNA(Asn)/glutamyl-tRNA(Gln) amidotransferase subunit A
VRIPAAWNDLVGLKTTHGVLSLDGVVPLRPNFDTVGPICRSVEDAAMLFAALDGGPATDLAGTDLAGAHFLLLEDPVVLPTRDGPREAFEAAVARLANAGARLDRGLPGSIPAALAVWPVVAGAEAYGVWRKEIEARPDLMFALIRDRFRAGGGTLAVDYVAALRELDIQRAAWCAATAAYDAILLPTTANLPPNVDRLLAEPDHYISENLLALRNPNIANLLGLCGLTIPAGSPSCGLMAMAAPRTEARLLRLGGALERALA